MRGDSVLVWIPVYGSLDFWLPLAKKASMSVSNQTFNGVVDAVTIMGENITECRNKAFREIEYYDWLIFLDADDELHPEYIEQMLKVSENADVIVPSVHRYYQAGPINTDQTPYQPRDLMTGNYIVVSAMIRTSLFKKLGGFHDYETLEDWDLWLRAEEAGARFVQCPEAILKVHKRVGSRNSNKSFNEILQNAKMRRGIA